MDQFIGTLEGLDNQTNRNLGIKLNAGYGGHRPWREPSRW
jgi:hypothetical protein